MLVFSMCKNKGRREDLLDVVHPVLPEDRECGVGTYDAVEETEHDEEEGQDVADNGERGCKSTDPLAPAADEEPEQHRHEENVAGCGAVGW